MKSLIILVLCLVTHAFTVAAQQPIKKKIQVQIQVGETSIQFKNKSNQSENLPGETANDLETNWENKTDTLLLNTEEELEEPVDSTATPEVQQMTFSPQAIQQLNASKKKKKTKAETAVESAKTRMETRRKEFAQRRAVRKAKFEVRRKARRARQQNQK